MKLNNHQRNFLIYIRDELACLGWEATIKDILYDDEYQLMDMYMVVDDFRKLRDSKSSGVIRGSYGDDLSKFGKPTKYLKG